MKYSVVLDPAPAPHQDALIEKNSGVRKNNDMVRINPGFKIGWRPRLCGVSEVSVKPNPEPVSQKPQPLSLEHRKVTQALSQSVLCSNHSVFS